MTTILGFTIKEVLGECIHSTSYKAIKADEPNVFYTIRSIKNKFISKDLVNHLEQQIELLSNLTLKNTILPSLENPNNDTIVFVQKYVDGITLNDFFSKKEKCSIEDILTYSILIAKELDYIHTAGHIHKGIKPNNIIINEARISVQLIDDVRVLDINQLSHFIYDKQFSLQTIPYLAPEQTGRINYSVNYSTDLYSLGVIMYEALSGKPPFSFDDPIETLHSHIADIPISLCDIDSSIPKVLSQVVDYLLEKAPEKRYQTASGLCADLEHCLKEYQQGKEIPDFILKRSDFSNRVTIPSLMVGRDTQKQEMLEEFDKSCSGSFRAALISGLSGIGKTRLIQELQLPIVKHHGYYCSGKFDQFRKHVPYSTLIQAFTFLIKSILTEDEKRLSYWHKHINNSLGINAKLMTDLIPELELLIGEQTEVPELPPKEARNRFMDTVSKLIASLCSKEHPLTLFMDDLQWCDEASFDLLEGIFENHIEYPYLFWIGAYRHNEVDSNHRLTHLIDKASHLKSPLLAIRLEVLGLKEVNQMTAYILNTYPSRTNALSEVIYRTSTGNPLFVNESLRWLHTYKHLHLNEEGNWDWDEDQLRHTKIPESALDLFKDKIAALAPDVVELLGIASLLGARFNANELALVAELSTSALYTALASAFSQNILIRNKQEISFFHDQVQAASESFMDEETKRKVHYKIATSFIAVIEEETPLDELHTLFPIVEHLAEGRPDNINDEGHKQESNFNYWAGIVAMRSLAVNNANHFFNQSKQLYPYDDWDRDYDFLFSLYKYLSRSEMVIGNQAKAEHILETLLTNSKTNLDKVECLYEQTKAFSSLGQFDKAIDYGNKGLALLNKAIPESDEESGKKFEILFEETHKNGRDIWKEILNTKSSKDRELHMQTGIYSELIPNYALSGKANQLFLCAIQSIKNCLSGGMNEFSLYGFAIIGIYLQSKDLYDLAFKYEDLCLEIAEQYPNSFGATKGINGSLWITRYSRVTPEQLIQECHTNINRGTNCGDITSAGLSYATCVWNMMHQSKSIKSIIKTNNEMQDFSTKYQLSLMQGICKATTLAYTSILSSFVQKYTAKENEKAIKQWTDDKHLVTIAAYYTLRGVSHFYIGEYKEATKNFENAKELLPSLNQNILYRVWHIFSYVNALRDDAVDSSETEAHLKKIEEWSSFGPTLKPYYLFMLAEKAADEKNLSEARRYYMDAIDSSFELNFILLQGYLEERLGELLLLGNRSKSLDSFKRAAILYKDCEADIKENHILNVYLLNENKHKDEDEDNSNIIADSKYLVNATKDIMQETDLNTLLGTIIKTIMKRIGAVTCYVLLKEKEHLTAYARGYKSKNIEITFKSNMQDEDLKYLSMGLVNYVQKTKKLLVIDDASKDSNFTVNNIVLQKELKSIFCLPLMLKDKIIGALYLENHLVPSVFTQKDIALIELLSAQVSISLENALLIEEIQLINEGLETTIKERTKEIEYINTELSDFAYSVSHDLKAPLRGIAQLSSWLEEDHIENLDDDGIELIQLLKKRSKQMHEMIEGLLQYSRVGRVEELSSEVDINNIVTEVAQYIAIPSSIKVIVKNNLPTVYREKTLLFQIFQNLMDNAVKYMNKENGTIEVSSKELDDSWELCVADNGSGIASKYQDKIFKIFQTLKAKDETTSTGIGLSLVKKITHNWGGDIWIESEEDQGCKFFFSIPKCSSTSVNKIKA